MSRTQRHWLWRALALTAVLAACSAAQAKESAAFVKDAEQCVAQGDLKAAEIELRSAAGDAPQDPVLRVRLAEIYLETLLGSGVSFADKPDAVKLLKDLPHS